MTNKLNVKIKKMHPDAIMPAYGTDGAAAFDLYAADVDESHIGVVIDTGIAFEIPEGYVMRVYSRSGHGFKYNVTLANSVGVIESDYRGSVKIRLAQFYHSYMPAAPVKVGDRVAQAIIEPIPRVEFEWADDLSDTVRGDGGFGSTGK